MNQTVNLHLPQWQATDRIHHDDFNDAFSKIDTALSHVGNCCIEVQTYTGTGTFGAASPCTLTFAKAPAIVLILGISPVIAFAQGTPYANSYQPTSNGNLQWLNLSWSNGGKTVSWYHGDNSFSQLNNSETLYTVIALSAA